MNKFLDEYRCLSDIEIVDRIISGDENIAAYLLIEKCGSRLKYLASQKYYSLQIKFHELISEMFIYLSENNWDKLRKFKGENPEGKQCRIENYISVIASRWLWKKMERTVHQIDWILPLYEIEGLNIPDELSERNRLAVEVMNAVMSMNNSKERDVILMYKIEGRSVHDVADVLKTTPGNIYTICNRAMKNLFVLLEGGNTYA
jgi:RNA polymerase sigma factor (sigma-70 family)